MAITNYKIKKQSLSIGKKQFDSLIILGAFFFVFFLLSLFRPLVSTDTGEYLKYYLRAISGFDQDLEVEYSYWILSKLANYLIPGELGFRLLLFFYQIISTYLLFILLSKSKYYVLTFGIYFCFAYVYQFSIQIRSCIANLIFILAVYDIFEKKWKSYYIKIIIAYFFHRSSIFFFLIYPLCFIVLRHKRILYILPLLLILIAKAFNPIIEYFADFAGNSDMQILKTFWIYARIGDYRNQQMNPYNKISLFLFLIYYYPIIKFSVRNLKKKECICLTIISLSIFCYFFGAYNIPIIASRYPEGLNLILLIYMPLFISHFAEKEIIYLFFYVYLALISHNYGTFSTILFFMRIY